MSAGVVRHELGDAVGLAERHAQRTAHVLDDRLGLHGPEGGDLGHAIMPVLLGAVLHDLKATAFAEVNVDIRHGHALHVEEALEQQIIRERV